MIQTETGKPPPGALFVRGIGTDWPRLHGSLEVDLGCQLDSALGIGITADHSELSGRNTHIRTGQHRVVEGIEHFQPELKPVAIVDLGILGKLQIKVLVTRIVHVRDRTRRIANLERYWLAIHVGVKPLLVGPVVQLGVQPAPFDSLRER